MPRPVTGRVGMPCSSLRRTCDATASGAVPPVPGGKSIYDDAWEPGVNYSLRAEMIRYDGRSMRAQYAERREMVSCRQMRWQQA